MRILICDYEYPPLGGGGGVVTAHLAQELATSHEVTVLTSQGMDLPPEREEQGVRVIRVPVFFRQQQATASMGSMLAYIPMGIRAGKKLLKQERFDIINTHFVLPTGPVGHALASFAGIPNVLSVHGGDLYDPSKFTSPHRHLLLRAWIKRLLLSADQVVGQSKNTQGNVNKFYAPELESSRIPLGIQRPVFTPAPRQQYGFSEDDFLMVTVGRLVTRKAVEQLIAMLSSLNTLQAHLIVIGSGPQESFLRAEAARLDVADKVRFTGYIDEEEKFQLIQMSDIYISTSQHEGFGLVFLEAMHCGLPIVCYDQGGQTDFLRDGETGYLVPLNDLGHFTQQCQRLIDDVASRRTMGEHNRQVVNEYYIDSCAKRYLDVFSEVLGARADDGSMSRSQSRPA